MPLPSIRMPALTAENQSVDDSSETWDLENFRERLTVQVQRLSNRSIEFDLVGVDASIANALRRVMMAEVPTTAVENVFIFTNTSVIADEVLSHRMGMIPLNIDPALMTMRSEELTDRDTVVFRVDIECRRNYDAPEGSTKDSELYINHELLSSHLTWIPQGEQATVFRDKSPAPTNPNIVLAKLRPGQEIRMDLHVAKGYGQDHAKFSPVATASYRILPSITLNPQKPVPPELALKFQRCFSPGVIHVDPVTKAVSVKDARKDTVSREALRHPEFNGRFTQGRVKNHFLFNVESEGPYAPERLLIEALICMRQKIAAIKEAAVALLDEDVEMAES
ncbi:hypothetical protein HGRIS_013228 [Hohenbuehelia grisea]|uniref:DNA-directed RNA polymerase RpoA/D/Rpb3-type domain-containing protein n=1 Tax=Hohenbuehelia grisea TaxID=104357 RepID=A0ABR3IUX8_9AGAR